MPCGFRYNGTSLNQFHLEKSTSHEIVVIFTHAVLDIQRGLPFFFFSSNLSNSASMVFLKSAIKRLSLQVSKVDFSEFKQVVWKLTLASSISGVNLQLLKTTTLHIRSFVFYFHYSSVQISVCSNLIYSNFSKAITTEVLFFQFLNIAIGLSSTDQMRRCGRQFVLII